MPTSSNFSTFPFAIEEVRRLAATQGKRFAVIADEAHSSQTNETAAKLKPCSRSRFAGPVSFVLVPAAAAVCDPTGAGSTICCAFGSVSAYDELMSSENMIDAFGVRSGPQFGPQFAPQPGPRP